MRKQFHYPAFFDVEKVIAHFDGVLGTHEALKAMGVDVTRQAVRKWKERGVVPADALVVLAAYDHRRGHNLFDLMERS